MCHADFLVEEAALLASHVIEQVKHVDPHSGGPTQLVTVTKGAVKHWTKVEIVQAEVRASEIEAKTAALWRRSAKTKTGGTRNGHRRKR